MTNQSNHSPPRSRIALWVSLLAAILLGGCATNNPRDPLEPFNRAMFNFNDVVDKTVAKPVARAYIAVTPRFVRTGVSNFFNNAGDLVSAANCLLQLRGQCAAENVMRFGVNSTLGFAGLLDIATEAGIPRTSTDFGITLGRYGVGTGPYLVVPLWGPTSVRDFTASYAGVDGQISPLRHIDNTKVRNGLFGLSLVNVRANVLRASEVFEDAAIDKYTFTREAFLQRRRNQVYDGNPPDEDEEASQDKDKEPPRNRSRAPAPSPEPGGGVPVPIR
jgi:phospholipid-binding lipoprotein MlaA